MPKIDIRAKTEKRQCITLELTHNCNLRCRYCYEHLKSPNQTMGIETAKSVITEFMEAENEYDGVEFDLSGGEPFLEFDLIREIIDWFHTRLWRKNHLFFIGTNGTILTESIKQWLIKNKKCVWVGVSLDGNKTAHDINRSDSYDQLMKNFPFFLEHWPNQPVKMTISAETIPYVAESIIELEEKNIPFTANIVYEDIWGNPENKEYLLNIYNHQLNQLVDYYEARPQLYPPRILDVLPEELIIYDRIKSSETDVVRFCGSGREMVSIDIDGSRSPCHRFAPWITGIPLPEEPVNWQTSWKPERCTNCRLVQICPICIGFNWEVNGDTSMRTVYHCDAFKLQVQAAAKLQTLWLLKNKPEDLTGISLEKQFILKQRIDALLLLAESQDLF